jgi:hypothetical protein
MGIALMLDSGLRTFFHPADYAFGSSALRALHPSTNVDTGR